MFLFSIPSIIFFHPWWNMEVVYILGWTSYHFGHVKFDNSLLFHCLIRHAMGEKFCIEIDYGLFVGLHRIKNIFKKIVKTAWKWTSDNTGVGFNRFCYTSYLFMKPSLKNEMHGGKFLPSLVRALRWLVRKKLKQLIN